MDLIIKSYEELSLNELYSILRGRQEVFALEQQILYQDLDFNDQKSIHFFIKEGDKVISYLRLIAPGVKYPNASIGRVYTLAEYRNQGYSRKLISRAIEEAEKLRYGNIKIEAQEYLTKFYESFGFRKISDRYILEDLYHVDMILEK